MERYQRGLSSVFLTSVVLAAVVLCLGFALLKGARHLSVLCLSVLGTMACLKVWATVGKSNVSYTLNAGRTRLFPGDVLHLRLAVENRKFLPLSFEAHIPVDPGLRIDGGGTLPAGRIDARGTLLWFESADLAWDLAAFRRGVHVVGPPVYETGDALGFYVNEDRTDGQIEVVVYPRIVHLHPLSIPRRLFFGTPGGESPVDDPVYILGTVDYHHSRPARYIHWKASARHSRLQEKVFEPTAQEKVLLVVDVAGFSGEPGASGQDPEAAPEQGLEDVFERTIEVVASLAAMLDRRGCAVGLATNGTVRGGSCLVPVARNPFQMTAILETLARVTSHPDMPVIELIRKSPSVRGGTTCVYFCRRPGSETDAARSLFRRLRIPVVFLDSNDVLSRSSGASPGPGAAPYPGSSGMDRRAATREVGL